MALIRCEEREEGGQIGFLIATAAFPFCFPVVGVGLGMGGTDCRFSIPQPHSYFTLSITVCQPAFYLFEYDEFDS